VKRSTASGHEQCDTCGVVRPWFVSGCPACKDPRQGKPFDANGPQRSDSGAPNAHPDDCPDCDAGFPQHCRHLTVGLVTVELTRAELDRLEVAWMEFNQPFAEFEWEPIDDGIAAKFRASLERTGK
jgi:hypothetical protein